MGVRGLTTFVDKHYTPKRVPLKRLQQELKLPGRPAPILLVIDAGAAIYGLKARACGRKP